MPVTHECWAHLDERSVVDQRWCARLIKLADTCTSGGIGPSVKFLLCGVCRRRRGPRLDEGAAIRYSLKARLLYTIRSAQVPERSLSTPLTGISKKKTLGDLVKEPLEARDIVLATRKDVCKAFSTQHWEISRPDYQELKGASIVI